MKSTTRAMRPSVKGTFIVRSLPQPPGHSMRQLEHGVSVPAPYPKPDVDMWLKRRGMWQ
jgi:hypothetical protein